MIRITNMFIGAILAIALLISSSSFAQPAMGTLMADGEIRKVDKELGKITIKHGEIKHMDMPPMTMVFMVRDKAMLDAVKPGDRIRFSFVNEAGKMTVTEIQAAQ